MPIKIIDNNGKEISEAGAIKAYFGKKDEQNLSMFMDELKQLTPEAKTKLAIGAAKELGWTVEQSS